MAFKTRGSLKFSVGLEGCVKKISLVENFSSILKKSVRFSSQIEVIGYLYIWRGHFIRKALYGLKIMRAPVVFLYTQRRYKLSRVLLGQRLFIRGAHI